MSELSIKTNNVPRLLLYGYQLTEKERKEFDYIDAEDFETHEFFRYKGILYDLGEFTRIPCMPTESPMNRWDGYAGDSFFSGVVIRYVREGNDHFDMDRIICGTYFS